MVAFQYTKQGVTYSQSRNTNMKCYIVAVGQKPQIAFILEKYPEKSVAQK